MKSVVLIQIIGESSIRSPGCYLRVNKLGFGAGKDRTYTAWLYKQSLQKKRNELAVDNSNSVCHFFWN